MTKYLRKLIVFVVGAVLAVVTSFLMPIEFYKEFLFFLLTVMIAFFAGNGIEHLSKVIGGRNVRQD